MLCFMHIIVDHSMHDERSSSNFANFNGINRNIQLRFCIEHQTKVTYIYIGILDSIGAVSVGGNQTTRRKHMH